MPPVKPKRPRKSRAKGSMKSPSHVRRGKPPHVPTDATRAAVSAMARDQIPHETIAKVAGCDPTTLRRHYADELDGGNQFTKGFVMAALIRKAGEGDVQAAKFYLERRGGPEWREPKDDAGTSTINLTITRAEPSLTEAPAAAEPSVTPVPDGHPAGVGS